MSYLMLSITSLPIASLLFILGVLLLYKGGDLLVDGAAKTAFRLGVAPLIIGLTVVAYGTSLPEFAVSSLAVSAGHSKIALGNILGSVIANILLVLGISALIKPLKVTKEIVKREAPVMLLSALLLLALCLRWVLDLASGIILLTCFGAYLAFFGWLAKRAKPNNYIYEKTPRWKISGMLILGFIGIILGAKLLVDSAIFIAHYLGICELVIALTIVAIGTSLPELAVSSIAAWKGHADISIGNVLGSNVFNVLLILGACSFIAPIIITKEAILSMILMLVVCALIIPLLWTGYRLSRKEGLLLLIGYALYLIYLRL